MRKHILPVVLLILYLVFGVPSPAAAKTPSQPGGQFAPSDFDARRRAAMEKCPDGILLLHSNSGLKHWDEFGFHQDPSFYYFTGLANLHGAILAIDGEARQSWLFVAPPAGPPSAGPTGLDRITVAPGKASESELKIDHI